MTETSSKKDKTKIKSLTGREQYWHSHYNRRQKSGLSLAGYARSLSINAEPLPRKKATSGLQMR